MSEPFKQWSFFLVPVLLLVACSPGTSGADDADTTQAIAATPVVNQQPDANLPFPVYENFSELEYIFQYQNDTTYVINFWATWCKPCVAELPYFERLHEESNDQPLKVIMVSLDFAKDVETKLAAFVRQKELKPQVIALTDGKYNDWIDRVHPDWGGAIPVTYIYRGDQVLFHDRQYDSYDELKASVTAVKDRS